MFSSTSISLHLLQIRENLDKLIAKFHKLSLLDRGEETQRVASAVLLKTQAANAIFSLRAWSNLVQSRALWLRSANIKSRFMQQIGTTVLQQCTGDFVYTVPLLLDKAIGELNLI